MIYKHYIISALQVTSNADHHVASKLLTLTLPVTTTDALQHFETG